MLSRRDALRAPVTPPVEPTPEAALRTAVRAAYYLGCAAQTENKSANDNPFAIQFGRAEETEAWLYGYLDTLSNTPYRRYPYQEEVALWKKEGDVHDHG